MWTRFKKEPAVVIGILAAAVLAAVQSLGGNGILSGSFVDWITHALDPNGGWALPLVLGIVTRFFVYAPFSTQKIANAATYLPAGTPVDIGHPPAGEG